MSAPARGGWGAFVLSLIFPGAGQFYAGSVKLGAGIWLASILLPLGMMSTILVAPAIIRVFLVFLVLYLLARLAQAIHAQRMTMTKRQATGPVVIFVVATYLAGTAHGLLMRRFLVEPFKVPSASMVPSLMPGDQFFVLKAGPHSRVGRGSVVIHDAEQKTRVQRVIGLPGETIAVNAGVLSINGTPVAKRPCVPPLRSWRDKNDPADRQSACWIESLEGHSWETLDEDRPGKDGEWVVPAGTYFLLGDNRANSLDSRFIGPTPQENVRGRVEGVWLAIVDEPPFWKLDRVGIRPYVDDPQ